MAPETYEEWRRRFAAEVDMALRERIATFQLIHDAKSLSPEGAIVLGALRVLQRMFHDISVGAAARVHSTPAEQAAPAEASPAQPASDAGSE